MRAALINQNDWIFTDSKVEDYKEIGEINTAKKTVFGFQILIEDIVQKPDIYIDDIPGLKWEFGQMLPVGVDENTAPKLMTSRNYEECKNYVTKKAPFYVYDCILDKISDIKDNKSVIYVRGITGEETFEGKVNITIKSGEECFVKTVYIKIHPVKVPASKEGKIELLNFFNYDFEDIKKKGEREYIELFKKHLKLMLDLGQTHIMLPLPDVIRNEKNEVVDFDFDFVVKIADIAIEAGAKYIVGACVSHWDSWDGDEYTLLWDKETNACSIKGFIQLKKYYTKWAEIVKKKGYEKYLFHSLADEPQIPNAKSYRSLAAIFRMFMPGIPIIEAVEALELGGALDIWVPKGETFERWENEYRAMIESGEKFWYYTCAFPAGAYMNRSMDLPACVSRYILWMVPFYGFHGYLHWGFNFYIGENIWEKSCCPHKNELLPAGDAHLVYTINDNVYPSLRFEIQRQARDEAEVFYMIKDEKIRKELISKAVRSQNVYNASSEIVEEVQKELYNLVSGR